MSIVTVARAKELVRSRAAFVGGPLFINQVHEGIELSGEGGTWTALKSVDENGAPALP